MIQTPPQPRNCNACQLSHSHGLASSAFARHYSRNHGCFLFLWVLRCFTSPRSLQLPYTFRQRSPDTTLDIQGFPIRTSPDHSSFTNSPGLIAGYNVLHRLLVPRHPPIALSSLPKKHTTKQCSRPLCNSQHTSGTKHPQHHNSIRSNPAAEETPHTTQDATSPSGPNSVPSNIPTTNTSPPHPHTAGSTNQHQSQKPSQCSTTRNPPAGEHTPPQQTQQPPHHTHVHHSSCHTGPLERR